MQARWLPLTIMPPLKALHLDTSLSPAKLAVLDKFSSDWLIETVAPGNEHCLHLLRERGENVDAIPREVIDSDQRRHR